MDNDEILDKDGVFKIEFEEYVMSKMGDAVAEFLYKGGRDLGYHDDKLPKLEDMDVILHLNINVWEYFGKTEEEYYT